MNIKKYIKSFIGSESFIYRIYLFYVYRMRRPSTVVIELTDRCNLACTYCPKSQGIGVGSTIVSHEDFVKMYDNLSNGVRPKLVSLVGFGEPLLNKNIHIHM